MGSSALMTAVASSSAGTRTCSPLSRRRPCVRRAAAQTEKGRAAPVETAMRPTPCCLLWRRVRREALGDVVGGVAGE
eukprot:365813-Chlamydomonas_euryale.AAC.16